MEGGMLLRNPDLSAVLRDIGRHGFNGFYRGDVGTRSPRRSRSAMAW